MTAALLLLAMLPGPTDAAYLRAFAAVESANRPQVRGDQGRSWGAYQFGRARWREVGGSPTAWGRASRAEQDRVFRTALRRYRADARRRGIVGGRDLTTFIARAHNAGRGDLRRTAYVRRIERELKR